LLMYHFMLGPEYTAGCPSCSAIADGFNGFAVHLEHHDVVMMAVSSAPIGAIQAYKRRMGWTFPWASSLRSDFNFDFDVSVTEEQQRTGEVHYNYRSWDIRPVLEGGGESTVAQMGARCGVDAATYIRQAPGMSAFALEDGVVYHTYSAYARGLDGLWGMYQWLDRAPKGRNRTDIWFPPPDEYCRRPTRRVVGGAERSARPGPCSLQPRLLSRLRRLSTSAQRLSPPRFSLAC